MPDPMAKRLGYALKRAQHAFRTRMDEGLRPLGLSAAQYAVLSAGELEPGLSNAALARAAFVTPQTMQGIIANVERDGLVARAADPSHGRILKTELTERGRIVLADAHKVSARLEEVMIKAVGRYQAGRLAGSLTRCANDLAGGDVD